eukprot:2516253-Amphidinium_carterae.2
MESWCVEETVVLHERIVVEAIASTFVDHYTNKGVGESIIAGKKRYRNPKLEELSAGIVTLGQAEYNGDLSASLARRPGAQ